MLRECSQLLVQHGVAAMRDVFRAIYHCDSAFGVRVGRPVLPQTHDIDKRRWGGQRAQGPITTYTRPYSTYSSLLYLSSTGLTPRLHIDDGMACLGATGRSSSCTECDPTYKNPAPSARKA